MYTIYLDEITGLAKIMKPTDKGQQLYSSFSTIQDFCNAFASNVKVTTPIIPPSCFKYGSTNEGRSLFMFYPGREIDFRLQHGSNPRVYHITIPSTVIKVCLSQPKNDKVIIVNAFIYFTNALIPTDDMKLYKPPFPNIYEDCKICFGGVVKGEYNVHNLFGIDSVHSMFFDNEANGDLFRGAKINGVMHEYVEDYMTALASVPVEDQLKNYFTSDRFNTIFSAITL